MVPVTGSGLLPDQYGYWPESLYWFCPINQRCFEFGISGEFAISSVPVFVFECWIIARLDPRQGISIDGGGSST